MDFERLMDTPGRAAAHKFYGKYSGVVVDNVDPLQLGNLKVLVPSLFGESKEPITARPCLPYGHFFVPPLEATVWVEFEAGDLAHPLWVGAWYPATQPPPAEGAPTHRVIHTPSGHTIELVDEDGEEKILIKHKSNAFISIDKHGGVLISNAKGSHIHLNAEKDGASFVEQHGNLVTMTDKGLVLVNNEGAMIELTGQQARIMAKEVMLQGSSVSLGEGAMEPTILGQSFASMWNAFAMHTHATAVGPSGPPIPPGLPLTPTFGLTNAVTVK